MHNVIINFPNLSSRSIGAIHLFFDLRCHLYSSFDYSTHYDYCGYSRAGTVDVAIGLLAFQRHNVLTGSS